MKKTLLYIVLFTYASMMCKPVLPYMVDIIAHTFYYKSHLATVHFENGKLHVHKEILQETEKEQQSGKPQHLKMDNQPTDYINAESASIQSPIQPAVNYYSINLSSYPPAYITVFKHPPRNLA